MPVFNVTFTKEFDVFVRAKSKEEVIKAIGCDIIREGGEIDRDWNAGDWEFDVCGLGSKRADMAIKDGQLVNILDTVECSHPKEPNQYGITPPWCDACVKKAEEGG